MIRTYFKKKKKREEKERERNIGIKDEMAINKYPLIITLNVNGLNVPIKRHRVDKWIRKHDLHICFLLETHHRINHSTGSK